MKFLYGIRAGSTLFVHIWSTICAKLRENWYQIFAILWKVRKNKSARKFLILAQTKCAKISINKVLRGAKNQYFLFFFKKKSDLSIDDLKKILFCENKD